MVRPLEGKKILVTRAAEQAGEFSRAILERGAMPVEIPVIAIRGARNASVREALERLPQYRWIIFTSANGIKFFFHLLHEAGLDFPAGVKVAVIGTKTLDTLQEHGINADLVPDEFVAESLVDSLKKQLKPGEPVLLPRGNLARDTLPNELAEFGADVTDAVVYETVFNEEIREDLAGALSTNGVDVVTFTSSSTVESFFRLLDGMDMDKCLSGKLIACIGPVTAETAREFGFEPAIVPENHTTSGMLDEIERFFEKDSDFE